MHIILSIQHNWIFFLLLGMSSVLFGQRKTPLPCLVSYNLLNGNYPRLCWWMLLSGCDRKQFFHLAHIYIYIREIEWKRIIDRKAIRVILVQGPASYRFPFVCLSLVRILIGTFILLPWMPLNWLPYIWHRISWAYLRIELRMVFHSFAVYEQYLAMSAMV